MTQTGKILVFVTLALSVTFLAWSIGLVTNRIYWHSPPATGGEKIIGKVDQLKDQIKKLAEARTGSNPSELGGADGRWYANTFRLQGLEAQRPKNQAFYADQLKIARTGTDTNGKAGNPPVKQVQVDANGALVFKDPFVIDGQPALSVQGYESAIKAKSEETLEDQKTVARLMQEIGELTQQVNGPKGLRVQLAQQEELGRNTQAELAYLQTPLTTYTVETQVLQRRKAALEARLKELQAAGTAVGRR
jgi:hypothetical protein